jgi:hypothetical protein
MGNQNGKTDDAGGESTGEPRGFIQKTVRAPKTVLDVFEEALDRAYSEDHPFKPAARRFLAHVWHCQSAHRHEYEEGVPISHRLIGKMDRAPHHKADTSQVWKPAVEEGLLKVREHRYIEGRSREFALSSDFMASLLEASEKGSSVKTRYNLTTGKRTRKKAQTALTYDGENSWKKRSTTIHRTLKQLEGQRDLVNKDAVDRELGRIKSELDHARDRYQSAAKVAVGNGAKTREHLFELARKYERARARYAQNRRIWNEIFGQGLVEAEDMPDGIYSYETAYEVQEASGRLTMKVGLQNASERVKAAAARGIPGYRNYDIKSSQTEALIQEFEDANERGADLDLSILTGYVGKDELAARHSIPRDVWKRPEHAVKFGAGFTYNSFENARSIAKRNAARYLSNHDHGTLRMDHETREAVYERLVYNRLPTLAQTARDWADEGYVGTPEEAYRLLEVTYGPMAEEIDRWREWLVGKYWNQENNPGGRGRFVENPCGLSFTVHSEDSDYDKKVAFATMRLQGLEAAYMHALCRLAPEYNYEFLRNEHDGAVVLGEIPDEAQRRAKEESGFRRATLEQKPFESPSEQPTEQSCASTLIPGKKPSRSATRPTASERSG